MTLTQHRPVDDPGRSLCRFRGRGRVRRVLGRLVPAAACTLSLTWFTVLPAAAVPQRPAVSLSISASTAPHGAVRAGHPVTVRAVGRGWSKVVRVRSWSLDFGDRTRAVRGSGALPVRSHVYRRAGRFRVSVTVADASGRHFWAVAPVVVRGRDAVAGGAGTPAAGGSVYPSAPSPGETDAVPAPAAWLDALRTDLNAYRLAHGVPALPSAACLNGAAVSWAQQLGAAGDLAHGGLPPCANGQSVSSAGAASPTAFTPAQEVELLTSDAPHRAVLLSQGVTALGVGAWWTQADDGTLTVVLDVGSR